MIDPIFNIFREEAKEHLRTLEAGYLDLESAADLEARRSHIDALFRHAHSLKGDARVIGCLELQRIAQVLEDDLDRLRENPQGADRAAIDHGLANLDRLRNAFEVWQAENFGEKPGSAATAGLSSAGANSPSAPSFTAATADESGSRNSAAAESFTVRVPSERLDRMLNMIGEMRIVQRSGLGISRHLFELRTNLEALAQGAHSEMRASLESAYDHIRRIETDVRKQTNRERMLTQSLEEDIRLARLLPMEMLADSLRRSVRDLSQTLHKRIRYEVEVGRILLDKAVIEALQTPLTHLVRNAADHGIEPESVRLSQGKPAEGVIRLQAHQRGDTVRIVVADDGAGFDYPRIRQLVASRADLSTDEAAALAEHELSAYLFQPGFTTSKPGAVSGRGVGLDVVRETLQRLQGRIELGQSSPQGTTFVLTVPLTVATIRVLTVWSNGQCFGIPSNSIAQTGRVKTAEIHQLEGNPVVSVDGHPVRWAVLSELLKIESPRPVVAGLTQSYLLISQPTQRLAVAVDELEDEREVLLKPLGFPLTGLPGVLGGTVRPDGSVQLVLDLTNERLAADRLPTNIPAVRARPGQILVVDDSPTTRAILRNLLSRAGYSVRTAVDGVDALEKLRSLAVDLVVSDFDMPRLNGLDLTRQIKARFRLPVILVTAREKEENRREGLEAGADAYVVKSTFEGAGLLDIVRQFV